MARVYNVFTGACVALLQGHENEISKISFNPQGNKIITASSDKTCRIWSTENGNELQVLDGHEDEIFSCAFNYEGDTEMDQEDAQPDVTPWIHEDPCVLQACGRKI